MSQKEMKIGIYLAFLPRTVLRGHGLAVYVRELTIALARRADVRVVIACPTWLQAELQNYLSEHVPAGRIEILTLKRRTLALVLLDALRQLVAFIRLLLRPRRSRLLRWLAAGLNRTLIAAGSATNPFVQAIIVGVGLVVAPVLAGLAAILWLPAQLIRAGMKELFDSQVWKHLQTQRSPGTSDWRSVALAVRSRLVVPLKLDVAEIGFRIMEVERRNLVAATNKRKDIVVWLVPTAFWTEIQGLAAPYVLSVPDFMFREIPVKFAELSEMSTSIADQIQKVVSRATNFVTFSRTVAHSPLVESSVKNNSAITVIPHGTTNLDGHIRVMGQPLRSFAVDRFATQLITAYRNTHMQGSEYLRSFSFESAEFIFYAAQARPNKNLMTLLRAYAKALREKYIYQKLILTADLTRLPDVWKYLLDNRLEYDVIMIPQASESLLAALYYKATLAVCPSFFEGGFPFTFAEAMSVGTPALLARSDVVIETLESEPDLMSAMTFDPFDVDGLAEKLAWGIANRSGLLALEKPLYERLSKRSWDVVAEEYIDLFKGIIDVDQVVGSNLTKPNRITADSAAPP
jgi:glycosyltransferase involved in cell wall biosynthesis